MKAVMASRCPAVVLSVFCLVIAAVAPLRADTVYLKHGDKMEGTILHVEESTSGIEYIRIQRGPAIITIPGRSIDRYEDIPEATNTPEATATFTATATWTPRPTWTPLPSPTPLPPPEIPAEPVVPQPSPSVESTGEQGREDWDPGTGEEDWEKYGESDGLGGLFGGRFENMEDYLDERTKGWSRYLSFVQSLMFIAAWIMCVKDGARKGGLTAALVFVFGAPCCCCINYVTLITYTFTKYQADSKLGPLILLFTALAIEIYFTVLALTGL